MISVVKESPASHAGLKLGDIITSMEGKRLEDFKDLPRLVALTKSLSKNNFPILLALLPVFSVPARVT